MLNNSKQHKTMEWRFTNQLYEVQKMYANEIKNANTIK